MGGLVPHRFQPPVYLQEGGGSGGVMEEPLVYLKVVGIVDGWPGAPSLPAPCVPAERNVVSSVRLQQRLCSVQCAAAAAAAARRPKHFTKPPIIIASRGHAGGAACAPALSVGGAEGCRAAYRVGGAAVRVGDAAYGREDERCFIKHGRCRGVQGCKRGRRGADKVPAIYTHTLFLSLFLSDLSHRSRALSAHPGTAAAHTLSDLPH
eukprot:1159051-Pelagomonas_calceolata.AAC.11